MIYLRATLPKRSLCNVLAWLMCNLAEADSDKIFLQQINILHYFSYTFKLSGKDNYWQQYCSNSPLPRLVRTMYDSWRFYAIKVRYSFFESFNSKERLLSLRCVMKMGNIKKSKVFLKYRSRELHYIIIRKLHDKFWKKARGKKCSRLTGL